MSSQPGSWGALVKLWRRHWAEVALTLDAIAIAGTGILALMGVPSAVQGEGSLLLIGGIALVFFGVMIALRWNLAAVKTGLLGLTAGYFATALTEFEVATDPCDIGSALERCATDVVRGAPWVVYQGPLILGVLLFVLIALAPRVRQGT